MQIGNFFQDLEIIKTNVTQFIRMSCSDIFGCSCNSNCYLSDKGTMPQVVIFAQKAETGSIQNVLLPFTTFRCTIFGFPGPSAITPYPSRSCYRMFYKMSFVDFTGFLVFYRIFWGGGWPKKSPVKWQRECLKMFHQVHPVHVLPKLPVVPAAHGAFST